ncbi:lipooligosaccharide transport system permease protein [Kineococcus xinjiangensis]|uniref:Transport permease protein n=1 Tax=Kineococcus xinjiangensis TaxID=512762 RepID=A0A2S6IVS6_9ACTN|nr:ABC transporter permease [Kineococcus xinjiangensis]PPK98467.1 lipooligosaccharide transport system permease protein [Kineococcus xinjiangensis]
MSVQAPPGGALRAVARSVPFPLGAGLAWRLLERNARSARRYWIVIASGFFEPVFYLLSLGVGLGALVGPIEVEPGRSVPYAMFVAPALLAASAMNGAVFDSTISVFFKLKYTRLYESVLSTPLRPWDVAVAEIGWALLRGAVYAGAFLLVLVAAGFVASWWALLALPAAVLIGFGFAAVGMAASTYMRTWTDFEFVQLAVLPMFLFSATFYPLSTYPPAVQWLVQATPLFHAVQLERSLLLGDVGWGLLGHAAVFAVMAAAGLVVAARRLDRLLLS